MIASIARPDASASRQPAGAAPAAPAVGLDDDVADVAGVGRRPVEQLAVEDDPAADAGRHRQHAVVVVAPWPRPASPRRGPAPCRRGRRRRGAPVSSSSRARSGNSRHAGMLTGETVSQWRVIGPADPTPTQATRTRWRSAASSCCSTMPASALKWASGPTFWSTSTTARSSSSPRDRHEAGGELGAADVDGEHDRRQAARRGWAASRRRRLGRRRGGVVVMSRASGSFVSKRLLGRARVRP